MDSKAVHQPVIALNEDDDDEDSDSSDHDTDTNTGSKLNHSPDTNYSIANAEVLQAFKSADCSVLWWRIVVKLVMICIAILVTALTYVQLSESEKKDFEAAVRDVLPMFLYHMSIN